MARNNRSPKPPFFSHHLTYSPTIQRSAFQKRTLAFYTAPQNAPIGVNHTKPPFPEKTEQKCTVFCNSSGKELPGWTNRACKMAGLGVQDAAPGDVIPAYVSLKEREGGPDDRTLCPVTGHV